MKIRLGYACINVTLDNHFKTITFKRFCELNKDYKILDKIINDNLNTLEEILIYNVKNDIYFYRMSANIIPLITHPDVLIDLNKYQSRFLKIGKIINKYHMRVDIHVDHYYVLNSINEDVVKATINIYEIYQNMFNLMRIKSNLIIHIGGASMSKDEGIKRFIHNYIKLNDNIKKIILIENDDKIYNIQDCVQIAKETGVGICLDYHHHLCNPVSNIGLYLDYIFKHNINIKMHFSSPKNQKEKRAHNDYINGIDFIEFLNVIKKYQKDIDIMLEAKMKDSALFSLVRLLKYYDVKIIGTTIYL